MKVRMKAGLTGTRNGEPWPDRGEVIDLPEQEARDLIHSGIAEPVVEDKVEKATAPKGEQRSRGLTTKSGVTKSDED